MNVAPETEFIVYADLEAPSLEGVAGVTVYEGDTAVIARTTAGIAQIASSTIYAVTLTSPADLGYYVASVDDGTDVQWPWPFRVVGSAYEPVVGDTYGNATELARRLKIRNVTDAQTDEMNRVLLEATEEINSEIDLDDEVELTAGQLAIAIGVNYDRAVELWSMSPFGIIGLGGETGGMYASKNSWEAYAHRLAPLKNQWGLA